MAAESYSNEAILSRACGEGTALNRETGKCEVVSPRYSTPSAATEVESVKCSSGMIYNSSKGVCETIVPTRENGMVKCPSNTILNESKGICEPMHATTAALQAAQHTDAATAGKLQSEGESAANKKTAALHDMMVEMQTKLKALGKNEKCESIDSKLTDFVRKTGSAFCGANTRFVNGRCVGHDPHNMCARGTQYDEAHKMCVPSLKILCQSGSIADATSESCIGPPPSSFCDSKTTVFDPKTSKCVPWVNVCEPGTTYNPATYTCSVQQCPSGQKWNHDEKKCVEFCGKGTHVVLDGKTGRRVCQVGKNICADGTIFDAQAGQCVAVPTAESPSLKGAPAAAKPVVRPSLKGAPAAAKPVDDLAMQKQASQTLQNIQKIVTTAEAKQQCTSFTSPPIGTAIMELASCCRPIPIKISSYDYTCPLSDANRQIANVMSNADERMKHAISKEALMSGVDVNSSASIEQRLNKLCGGQKSAETAKKSTADINFMAKSCCGMSESVLDMRHKSAISINDAVSVEGKCLLSLSSNITLSMFDDVSQSK